MVIKTAEEGWGELEGIVGGPWMTENVIVSEVGASFLGYRLCFPELRFEAKSHRESGLLQCVVCLGVQK